MRLLFSLPLNYFSFSIIILINKEIRERGNKMQIRGKISYCFCVKSDGWAVFLVEDESDHKTTYKCSGKAHNIKEGMSVEIQAEEIEHPTYGRQYNIISFRSIIPEGIDGIRAFLSSGIIKGIGPETAKKIVKEFGKDTIRIIQTNPEALLKIPRITQKKLDAIVAGYQRFDSYGAIFQLTEGTITLHEVDKIVERYGDQALEILKTDPYKICQDIDGFGFIKADKIARACGVDELAPCRMQAGIEYTLNQISQSQGHCYITVDEMQTEAIRLLNRLPMALAKIRGFEKNCFRAFNNWDEEKDAFFKQYKLEQSDIDLMEAWYEKSIGVVKGLADGISELNEEGRIIVEDKFIMSRRLYDAEREIAKIACEMMKREPVFCNRDTIIKFIDDYERQSGFSATEEQKKSVIFGATHRFSIITGGPGCGKTTNIKTIIAFWRAYVGYDIILLAPTGRAAQRIRESVGDSTLQITTIHKMIGYGSGNPMCLPDDNTLIICDECSMADVIIGSALMRFSQNSTLILVGDKDQLPPVGPGNMFKDLIWSGMVPVTTLATCFRNGGMIDENSRLINQGKTWLNKGEDFELFDLPREQILGCMVTDYVQSIRRGVPMRDICVVSLQNVRGATSVQALNMAIQKELNSKTNQVIKNAYKDGTEFRLGDRVMQIKNNYSMEYELNGQAGLGVFNGDIGIITGIDTKDEQIWVTFDDGRVVTYGRADFVELVLAYAVTAHKVQGSEYKYVLFSMCLDQYKLLTRAILYTIVTRARQKVTGYVERKALNIAIRTPGNNVRNTKLIDFLLDYA